MTINKDQLKAHISTSNDLFTNEIIEIIKDDVYWLGKLGIKEADIKIDQSISEIIKTKLSDPENKESIDLILKYVIGNHLLDDYEIPIARIEYSDLAFISVNAFYIFKCANLYFCYYFMGHGQHSTVPDLESKTLITKDPLNFSQNVITEIYKEYISLQSNLDTIHSFEDDTWEGLIESGEVHLAYNWNYDFN